MWIVLVVLGVGASCWLAGYLVAARVREKVMVKPEKGGSPYRSADLVEKIRSIGVNQMFADAPRASWIMAMLFVGACVLSCLAGKGGPFIAEMADDATRWATGPDERVENLYQASQFGLIEGESFAEAAGALDIEDLVEWIRDTNEGDTFDRGWNDREGFFRQVITARANTADQQVLAEYVMTGPGAVFGSWCSEAAMRDSSVMMHALAGSSPSSQEAVRTVIGATQLECTFLTDWFSDGEHQDAYRNYSGRVLSAWQNRHEREMNRIMTDIYLTE